MFFFVSSNYIFFVLCAEKEGGVLNLRVNFFNFEDDREKPSSNFYWF